MKDFIKKYAIGFILGAIIFGPLSYVTATTIAARNITYNGANTNASLTNVQDAIEKLYIMSTPVITFTIAGTTYQADNGMTWGEWLDSSYNTGGFWCNAGSPCATHMPSVVKKAENVFVRLSDQSTGVSTDNPVIANYSYTLYTSSICFTEDTKVKTNEGYKIIKDIQIGDKVYSYNEETNKVETNKVINTFENKTDTLFEIKSGNKIINITENHKVYVKSKYGYEYKWIKAKDIKEGDYLYSIDGKEVSIDSIKIHKLDKEIKVYNLEIENNHTYYVTENDYLVHNAC